MADEAVTTAQKVPTAGLKGSQAQSVHNLSGSPPSDRDAMHQHSSTTLIIKDSQAQLVHNLSGSSPSDRDAMHQRSTTL